MDRIGAAAIYLSKRIPINAKPDTMLLLIAMILILVASSGCAADESRRSFQLRPVLGVDKVLGNKCPSGVEINPDPLLETTACSRDLQTSYRLGPAFETSADVGSVEVAADPTTPGNGLINIMFSPAGASSLRLASAELSRNPPPRNQAATMIDGIIVQISPLTQEIAGGAAQISGNNLAEAQLLASQIK